VSLEASTSALDELGPHFLSQIARSLSSQPPPFAGKDGSRESERDMKREASRITAEEFENALRFGIPFTNQFSYKMECLESGYARMRMQFDERHVRPGGTIAGPLLVMVADAALYAMVMSVLGMELFAVTSNLNIHFLRKPSPVDVIGEATMIRKGRRMIVGEVLLYSDGESEPIAHVTGSYALP
jgi:uncharacterized protein (TIGR00369 family)